MKKYLLFLLALFPVFAFSQPLPDTIPNPTTKGIVNYTAYGNKLVFTAGTELWISDGTVNGTQFLYQFFRPSTGDSLIGVPYGYRELNNKLYFIASDSLHGRELWVTDGSPGGTQIVKDIKADTANAFGNFIPFSRELTNTLQVLNGKLYFAADDGVSGYEIWESDGTAAGTHIAFDLCTGACSGAPDQNRLFSNGGNLYFYGYLQGTMSQSFSTDGTLTGTVALLDTSFLQPIRYIPYGNKVLYTHSYEDIYITDGTSAGTTVLVPNAASTLDHVELNGRLYFFAQEANDLFGRLMETDGTVAGTHVIKDSLSPNTYIMHKAFQTVPKFFLTEYQGKLYFAAASFNNDTLGVELWESDGTTAGTQMVKDLLPGPGRSLPMHLTVLGGKLYFQARDSSRYDMWQSDGTATGTTPIVMPGANSVIPFFNLILGRWFLPKTIVPVGNRLYFFAHYMNDMGYRIYQLDVFPVSAGSTAKPTWIDIYPNPTTGILNINAENARNIYIHSVTGESVYSGKVKEGDVKHVANVQQLAPGTYTVTTTLNDGSKQYGKFVKQ